MDDGKIVFMKGGQTSFMEHAVRIAAALARPSSEIAISRILNFWTLPVTVIGKASTSFQ